MGSCVHVCAVAVTFECSQGPGLPGTPYEYRDMKLGSICPPRLFRGPYFPKPQFQTQPQLVGLKAQTHGGDPKRQVLQVSLRGSSGPEPSLPTTITRRQLLSVCSGHLASLRTAVSPRRLARLTVCLSLPDCVSLSARYFGRDLGTPALTEAECGAPRGWGRCCTGQACSSSSLALRFQYELPLGSGNYFWVQGGGLWRQKQVDLYEFGGLYGEF